MNKPKPVIRVVVTGSAGQIGYSISQPIACGHAFGLDQPIHIVLFDLPRCEDMLKGVQVELEDLASPVLMGTTIATSGDVAFKDADYVVCLAGAMAIKEGVTRGMLAQTNKTIYEEHGKLLDAYAKKTVKVLVVANPCNTMCLVMSHNAPSIPKMNFSSMSRLDQNRGQSMIASKLGVSTSCVQKVCVWGNHSSTMVPDFNYCDVKMPCGTANKALIIIKDDNFWSKLIPAIQERAYLVVKYRKNTSALSSAISAINHLRDWHCGTPEGHYSSMGVYSAGNYNTPIGVYFSFPCVCKDGKWEIVQNLIIPDDIREKLKITGDELIKEKQEMGL